jgi:hypothetical protein
LVEEVSRDRHPLPWYVRRAADLRYRRDRLRWTARTVVARLRRRCASCGRRLDAGCKMDCGGPT